MKHWWLTTILMLVGIICLIEFAFILDGIRRSNVSANLNSTISKLNSTIDQAQATMTTLNQYTAAQAQVFNSRENKQMLQALRDASATTIKILRKVDQHTLPELDSTIAELRTPINDLSVMIRNTDASVNLSIMPMFALTAKSLNVSLDALSSAIQTVTSKSVLTLDDIHSLMSDPSWKQALDNVASSTKHIDSMTESTDLAMKSMPDIAHQVDKIFVTASKYQRAIILVGILSTIARAVIP